MEENLDRKAFAFCLKCDLAELAGSLSLASPASRNPCVFCTCTSQGVGGLDFTHLKSLDAQRPFLELDADAFNACVKACQISLETLAWTEAQWQQLFSALEVRTGNPKE
eukprot:1772730-Amphidinium_carterae.1